MEPSVCVANMRMTYYNVAHQVQHKCVLCLGGLSRMVFRVVTSEYYQGVAPSSREIARAASRT